jgi:hypothetical protein
MPGLSGSNAGQPPVIRTSQVVTTSTIYQGGPRGSNVGGPRGSNVDNTAAQIGGPRME